MNGFVPDPMDWMRVMLDVQKAQLEAAEKLAQDRNAGLGILMDGERRQQLETAGKEAFEAVENWSRAQWEWLNLWRI